MTRASDRRQAIELIDQAHNDGARIRRCCQQMGISARTYRRWRGSDQEHCFDQRPHCTRPKPGHALSPEERALIVAVCNESRFASVPPAQVVARLADEVRYIASEASFYRVLRDEGLQHHRGKSAAPKGGKDPDRHFATAPNQVW
jgi:putative transposase